MQMQRQSEVSLKEVVTVAEMARMVGLSRARFYQLQREGAFPLPVYSITTRRPFYIEEQQRVCLQVRRRNCGENGMPILFYAKGPSPPKQAKAKVAAESVAANAGVDAEVLGFIQAIEPRATSQQVRAALRQLYPQRQPGADDGQAMRAVALHVRRQNSGDNVGR